MERYPIDVVFRTWPDGTIDALFPYEAELNYKVGGYTRLGQHFIADYDYVVSKTKLATPEQFERLHHELTHTVGYDIRVMTKVNRSKMLRGQIETNKLKSQF
jgi:hypothetical protein